MKRITLVLTTKDQAGPEFDQLIEAISAKFPVKTTSYDTELDVLAKDVDQIQRIFSVNGYKVVDKRDQDFSKSKLSGALDILGEKYEIDDRPREVRPPPSVHKRNVMSFVNRKARAARKKRNNTRVQGKRDRLDGKISALEDMLRYLRKR